MVLVDTSVLIDFLRKTDNKKVEKFRHVLSMEIPFGINFYIYQELLQGVDLEKDYEELKKYLDTQRFYRLQRGKDSYSDAARIYLDCRKKGFTISSTIDCLIVQTAIENDLLLLHNDSDFDHIGKIIRKLRIY